MLLKVLISKEDGISEVFEISNYYEEANKYLEADIDDVKGIDGRAIILQDGLYMNESNEWEEISIISNTGLELTKFIYEGEL